jgi:hypothetical protein
MAQRCRYDNGAMRRRGGEIQTLNLRAHSPAFPVRLVVVTRGRVHRKNAEPKRTVHPVGCCKFRLNEIGNLMQRIIRLLIASLLCVWVVGCVSSNTTYDDRKISLITKDTTTEAQLVEWFGAPATRVLSENGAKVLTWKFPAHGTTPSGRLEARIGTDGKVTAYNASSGVK